MRSILILQRQLWLLLLVMLSMITARSPIEILASNVRALQLSSNIPINHNHDNHEIMSAYKAALDSLTISSTKRPQHVYVPIEKYPQLNIETISPPPAFVLFTPSLNFNPYLHNTQSNVHRRQDDNEDDLEAAASSSSTTSSKSHPQQIVVAWPAGLELPSRKIPLRFIAAMAVPVTTLNTDPLLTQGELSEVVYYSSMDLRKLNITGNNKVLLKHNRINIIKPTELEEEPSYTEPDNITPINTVTPSFESTSITSISDTILPTTEKPTTLFPTLTTNDVGENGADSEDEDDRQRRSWFNEGISPRSTDRNLPKSSGTPRGHQWMDGESVAYIAVGTCCGISVLTLAVVLLVLRVRGNFAAKRRRHFNNIITVKGQRKNGDGKNSSVDSLSNLSDESATIHLPQRLLNIMNTRSQEVSTHKLGSWFNGRPSTLSIRHGTNMAFPAPIRSFHAEEAHQQLDEESNNLNSDDILEVSSSDFTPEEMNGDFDFDESVSSNSNNNDVPKSLEPVLEGTESSSSQDGSLSGSKHDTFIFWSTNSDRLV